MSSVGTYLNFMGNTEEAFNFYAKAFDTKISFLQRFNEMDIPEHKNLTDEERNGIMHISMPILDGHIIYGTDMIKSLGHDCTVGNNTTISLNFDSAEEGKKVYALLAEGSTEGVPIQEMPWGAYWGVALDKYGIRWMFSAPLN